MRALLLLVTLLFLAGLLFLTIYDISHNGTVTALDVVSILIIAFFGVAVVGALTYRGPAPEGLPEPGRDRLDDFR